MYVIASYTLRMYILLVGMYIYKLYMLHVHVHVTVCMNIVYMYSVCNKIVSLLNHIAIFVHDAIVKL